MVTVTIGKSYFEALLRRAEFHSSPQDVDFGPSLFHHVTISRAEHDYLLSSERNYHLLKSALFRGGLTNETLETLLEGESGASTAENASQYDYQTQETLSYPTPIPSSGSTQHRIASSETSDAYTVQTVDGVVQPRGGFRRDVSYGEHESSFDSPPRNDHVEEHVQTVPVYDKRTVLITNLSGHTTHKDLAGIVRGGRLLDIFIRNDHTATVSFVEGAANFLAYAKRTDVYLNTKRLEFRWADRHFHVPSHVSTKIANGATRNLVVRGGASKLNEAQVRDHLEHIHNLVVVDVAFRNGDVYISTNSIHNALFARTCMMSRTAYKGLRIEYYADECAGPLPRIKPRVPTPPTALKPKSITNTFAVLETESDTELNSEDGSYVTEGVRVDYNHWADATVA
ncbi:hypothetical protein BDU57DRAFT_509795 [Ampelomyces quisqualis]|uniref:RRM domain-containing protein n=1 Tax=Ampelomyces quisqualis TaxID=50730 RepID=A0A6A5R2E5_AMPQU|nr:hypothetical protein BDU57DRAFT_509795 [Ampelomyces quisqualis]